jgi:hypothetical protein
MGVRLPGRYFEALLVGRRDHGRERQLWKDSIHAPAQGARAIELLSYQREEFQSMPPRRGRLWLNSALGICQRLNPRPRAGGDSAMLSMPDSLVLFESTPPRRGRLLEHVAAGGSLRFESTPPRRGRPEQSSAEGPSVGRLNPRPRAGGDPSMSHHVTTGKGFQSTPPRRGRRSPSKRFSNNGKPRCSREPMREAGSAAGQRRHATAKPLPG